MEQTECSETSAFKTQTPGNYPKEITQHSKHGEILKSINIVIFQLYEEELSNSIVMYSLFFSSCCYRIFGIGLDLKIYRWTILSNKVWASYYTSGTSRDCKPVAPSTIPKSLNCKKKSMEISNISRYIVLSPIFLWFSYSALVHGRTNS
jgi:hypothetical protein